MQETWEDWQDGVLDVRFPLHQHLGGSEHSAVFLMERCAPEVQRAAIKLIRTDLSRAQQELARLEAAARLSHPNLIRLFQVGCWRGGRSCLRPERVSRNEGRMGNVSR
jgi:hypothetical protein